MLNQLYVHFECFFQLLHLLEVIIGAAESKSTLSEKSEVSVSEQQTGPQLLTSDTEMNADSGGVSARVGTSNKVASFSKPTTSAADNECDTQTVLLNLPQAELRLLCSLLAREGYKMINTLIFLFTVLFIGKLFSLTMIKFV